MLHLFLFLLSGGWTPAKMKQMQFVSHLLHRKAYKSEKAPSSSAARAKRTIRTVRARRQKNLGLVDVSKPSADQVFNN